MFMDTLDSESAEAATEAEQGTGDSGGAAVQVTASDRKLIKQQEYSVETKAFTEFVDALEGVVADSGGYVEYSDISGKKVNMETIGMPDIPLESLRIDWIILKAR